MTKETMQLHIWICACEILHNFLIENVYGNFYNDHNDLIDEANEEVNMVNFRGVWQLIVKMKREYIKSFLL